MSDPQESIEQARRCLVGRANVDLAEAAAHHLLDALRAMGAGDALTRVGLQLVEQSALVHEGRCCDRRKVAESDAHELAEAIAVGGKARPNVAARALNYSPAKCIE